MADRALHHPCLLLPSRACLYCAAKIAAGCDLLRKASDWVLQQGVEPPQYTEILEYVKTFSEPVASLQALFASASHPIGQVLAHGCTSL